MPLATKTRLGPYEVITLLGAGGMGEVYEARDTRLDRIVAIKICKGGLSERFEREARAISSLNHQHICALYDIGREDSVEFLVMEYLEGDTLEVRLRKGALRIDEALRIGTQIASALDTAHRKGVVHRDLKPGNVMLTRSGAKLLDFGLARIGKPVSFSGTVAPTAMLPLTEKGTILGTVHYMSPEQLEGKEADTRSDIFAFGAMFYEMVTGCKSFEGSSHASVIAAVMSANPPAVSTMQPMASPSLDRLVRKCLAKSPDDRWQNAGDLLSELEWIAETDAKVGVPVAVAAKGRNRERLAWLVAGLTAALLVASLIWAAVRIRKGPSGIAAVRFQVYPPDKLIFKLSDTPAISPDGERIAFTASPSVPGTPLLFVRPLNSAIPTEIPTENVVGYPFWSPDGQQIAFFSENSLQRVDASGGSPITICKCSGVAGTWNRDGVIVIAFMSGALYRVDASGGEAKPLRPYADGETAQKWPQFLPDGKHYLYFGRSDRPGQQGIYAASLDSNDRKFIVATDFNAAYVPTGQLLFMRGDSLVAQRIDLQDLTLRGEPHAVVNHIEGAGNFNDPRSGAIFSASLNGALVWRRGSSQPSASILHWVDRNGKNLGVVGEPAEYWAPALSPDEKKLAVGIRDTVTKTRDIWIFDLLRGSRTRLTFDPSEDLNPVWSPDGTRIAFSSDRRGPRDIYQKRADGSGPEELLLEGKEGQRNVENWSRDGQYLLYNYRPPNSPYAHLYVLPLAGDRNPVPFLETEFDTGWGRLSPNDRWLAYRSLESNKLEVYVQGFTLDPSQPRGKWLVSTNGGEHPQWRGDGKELYYRNGSTFFAVDVKTDGKSFEAGLPQPLFQAVTAQSNLRGETPFVVTRDGQRFLILAPVNGGASPPLEVLVKWQ
jgi:serine/threonine protein kinase